MFDVHNAITILTQKPTNAAAVPNWIQGVFGLCDMPDRATIECRNNELKRVLCKRKRFDNTQLDVELALGYKLVCQMYDTFLKREKLYEELTDDLQMVQPVVDHLYSFMKDGTTFRYHPVFFMPMRDFRDMYTEYRKQLGLATQMWTKEVYTQVFQGMGIHVQRCPGERTYRNSKIRDVWIDGVDLLADEISV